MTLPFRGAVNPFRTLLLHRNFRIFWIGQTLSLIGTWMQVMGQGWLALELTNNAFLVGLVSAIGALPILLFSLLAGFVADHTNKLRLVTAMQALLLVEATVLFLLTLTHRITIDWLLLLAAANGAFSAFEIPARQAMMVELVGGNRDDLHDAIALNSSGFNLARVIGPAIGAAMIASAGVAWCFALNGVSYLAVLVSLFLIRLPRYAPPASTASPVAGMLEGIRYMRGTPAVSAILRLMTAYSICGVPFLVLMPVVARDVLREGARGYGLLLSCVGIGGLAGALFLAAAGARIRRGRLLRISAYAYAVLLVAFALSRSLALSCVLLLAIGCMMIVNMALANGLLQSMVPDALRGRLMAAYSFIVVGLAQVVGAFIAGAVARDVGVDWAIGGAAALMLLYARYIFVRYPAVTRL
jgi:MFS family permease